MNIRALGYGKMHKHENYLSYYKYGTLMARTFQLAMLERTESFPNIKMYQV